MSNTKLLESELQQLKDLQRKTNEIIFSIGSMELRRLNIKNSKNELIGQYQSLVQNQEKLGKELNEKYGDGSIDLEKGEFIKSK